LATLSLPALAAPPNDGGDPWFVSHAFVGMDGCLMVREGQSLATGDSVLVLTAGRAAAQAHISSSFPAHSANLIFQERHLDGVRADPGLWSRIGCFWGLRGATPLPASIARYGTTGSADGVLPLALQSLPARVAEIGGAADTLGPKELSALARRLVPFVPREFSQGRILRAGLRYGSEPGRELLEVFLGNPTYNAPGAATPIDSIRICHVFVRKGRVLAFERFSRTSGVAEHVHLEPPQLDERNWFETTETTLGFVSLDGGVTWDQLSVDVGFEGISWWVVRLARGMPQLWNCYLYTYH
jgi:hypothetical protein